MENDQPAQVGSNVGLGPATNKLRIQDTDESAFEAEIRHGMMVFQMEQEDAENGPGAFIIVHFMPTKAQAALLAGMLSRWAETRA